ncbi:tape measure protein [Methylomonas sp. HYX-M1]|uniref:tape measure protein n=1 Tax=Methylomonas sp. HYX-M1 TaxID=3139307 RepID=UPI00345C45C9
MANNLELKIKIGADGKEALDAFVALSKKLRDTQSDFRTAQETVQRLAREMKASDAPSKALTESFEKAKKTVSDLSGKIDKYRDSLGQQRAALSSAGVDVANLTEAYKKLARSSDEAAKTRSLGDSFKTLDFKPFSEIQSKIDGLNSAYKALSDSGKLSMGELAKAKLQLKDKTAELHSQMNNFGGALENLNGKWLAFAGAVAGAGVAFKSLIDAGVKMEAIKSQLDAVTGSGEKTADALKYIHDESNRLGQRTDVMAEGFAKLAAAAKGTALEGQPLKELFSGVAEASTVMHLSADRANGVLNALSQMMGKGVVSAEEFRQQLGDHLPQATQVGAKALGVTTAEFTKMLNSGQILASDFLPKFGKALRESVAGGLPQATQGATAAFNRLYNAVLEFKQGLVGGGLMAVVAALANALAKLIEVINGFSPVTKAFIGALLTIGGGFVAWKLAIAPVVSAISSALIPVMTGATLATGALSVALRALPFIGLGLLIFEGVRALGQWISGAKDADQATAQLNQQTANTKAAIDAAVGQYDAAYAKMAENIKGITELQKGQYQQQLTDLNAKLAQENADVAANAALSEQQKEQAKTDAFISASAQRLTIIQTFQAAQLQQLDVYHAQEKAAKQAQLNALNGEELQKRQALQSQLGAMDLAHLEARRGVYQQAQTDLNTHIGNLITERQRELDAANSIAQQMVGNEQAREQAILAIQRAAMDEKSLMRSKEKEESQKIAEFQAELAKGESVSASELNRLAGEAKTLIVSNATEKAKSAQSGWEADQKTKEGVGKVNDVYDKLNKALATSQERHTDNAEAIDSEMKAATDALGSIQAAIGEIEKRLLDAKMLRIEIDQDSLSVAQQIIAGLTKPETKIITIKTVNEGGGGAPAQATGGLAGQPTGRPWRFAEGGWARMAGLLSGYGGGDRRRALLEDGEFVVRKEAVKKLGVPVLQLVNQGQLPIQRAAGGSVGDAVDAAIKKDVLEQIKRLLQLRQAMTSNYYSSGLGGSTLFAERVAQQSIQQPLQALMQQLDTQTAEQVRQILAYVPKLRVYRNANKLTSSVGDNFIDQRQEAAAKRDQTVFDAMLSKLGSGNPLSGLSAKIQQAATVKVPSIPSINLPQVGLPTSAEAAQAGQAVRVRFESPAGQAVTARFSSQADVQKMLDVLRQSGATVGVS